MLGSGNKTLKRCTLLSLALVALLTTVYTLGYDGRHERQIYHKIRPYAETLLTSTGVHQHEPHHHGDGNAPVESRYESNDVWRKGEPPRPQTQYPKGSDKIFFMFKTGGTELWDKLPVHMFTSIPQMKNFAFYSDAPGSIGGYEVIDILRNVSEARRNGVEEFQMYQLQRELHDLHGVWDYSGNDLNQGWALDRYKNVPMLYDAYTKCPDCEWFLQLDADSYIMVDNLAQWVQQFNPDDKHYLGHVVGGGQFVHGGSGILVSRGAVQSVFAKKPPHEMLEQYEGVAQHSCCGDLALGLMLQRELDIKCSTGIDDKIWAHAFLGDPYWDAKIYDRLWCEPVLSYHHVSPHDIQVTWDWEQTKLRQRKGHRHHNRRSRSGSRGYITHADLYRDLILPYIDEERQNWDNLARDEKIDRNSGDEKDAWKSKDKCKQHCADKGNCLMWRYEPKNQYCTLSRSVRLGRPTHKNLVNKHPQQSKEEQQNVGATSGWMIDRIRTVRQKSGCDRPHDYERPNEDRREGWWLRQHHAHDGLTQDLSRKKD